MQYHFEHVLSAILGYHFAGYTIEYPRSHTYFLTQPLRTVSTPKKYYLLTSEIFHVITKESLS